MGDGVDPSVRDRARAGTARAGTAARAAATRGGDLGRSVASKGVAARQRMARLDVPWARCGIARHVRQAILSWVLGPMIRYYMRVRTHGAERFEELEPPVVFVSNHSSHLDTPMILRALPRKWRQRTAVAAAADYFYKKRLTASFVALLFNTVPIQRRGGGLGDGATDHVDRLINQRWNLVMYPEGTRSRDGRIGKLRSGAAALASQHGLSIVPIYVTGTHDAMPPGQNWPKLRRGKLFPRRHRIEVRFGEPIAPRDPAQRRDVMAEVQAFWERKGLPEDGRDPSEIHDVLLIHEVLRIHEAAAARKRTGRFEKVVPLAAETVPDQPSPAA
jgi:1-acyl-sn-glycerol-3-phosphate acyltransferase